ncbi:protein of unknown function (plasmid) [Caballeronia sp. S22]
MPSLYEKKFGVLLNVYVSAR